MILEIPAELANDFGATIQCDVKGSFLTLSCFRGDDLKPSKKLNQGEVDQKQYDNEIAKAFGWVK